MKKLLLLLSVAMICHISKAQIAPDFTITDIDGNSHNLYEYLDAGTTVILDFYAVWCGPCQVNASGVENVYEEFGPNGTNEIMILGIEADDESTDEEVAQYAIDYNCSNPQINTEGDVDDLFGIQYYPTYFVVCPDRSYQEYSGDGPDVIETELTLGIELCEEWDGEAIDARLFSYNSSSILCSETTIPNITLMNMGSENLTSLDIHVNVNGNLQSTTNWTGDLELYEYEFISLPEIDLAGFSDPVINVSLENPNGISDPNPDNDQVNIDIEFGGVNYETQTIHFQLYFDNFPQETSWDFKNSVGDVVMSGDGYLGFPDFSPPIDTYLELPLNDCYTFTIYDSFSDGICCAFADEGEGFWKIFTEEEELIAEGGVFTDQESAIFGLTGTVDVNSMSDVEFNIYPNPSHGNITIETDQSGYTWTLNSLDGKLISHSTQALNGTTELLLDRSIQNGIYFINIQFENGEFETRKIIVE